MGTGRVTGTTGGAVTSVDEVVVDTAKAASTARCRAW
jgi:hypothetical protein